MNDRDMRMTSVPLIFAALLGAATGAGAVDGVMLIDQSRALAGNVTPGDGPGFPVTITQPGSYRLASNLTVADANTNVIEVRATNVTIDLNGFTIAGPNICNLASNGTVTCSQPGSGAGVRSTPTAPLASQGIVVTNGTIRGMGSAAIDLASGDSTRSRVSGILATSNGFGITVGTSTTVTRNVVNTNLGTGVAVGGASLVLENVISFNGGVGLSAVTSTASIGYALNVITSNVGGNVSGGVALGLNACDNNLVCP